MAQTVEELAELLDSIKLEASRNAESFDKILNNINNKLEFMSNDTEHEDLIKVYLTELKKALEERHALVVEEFNKIENSFNTLTSEQANLVKTSEMKEMFDIFTTNMQSVAQELFNQRDLLSKYEANLAQYTSDKTDKNDILESISSIRNDVNAINQSFGASIAEINSNVQSIFKNLIVMDPSAQNDIVKRELENIYLSTNSILNALHTVEQKSDDIIHHFDNLITKEDFEQTKTKLGEFSAVLDALKSGIISSNEDVVREIREQLDKLNSVLSSVVTENDFAGFRHDLADFIQKIIDNSASLNSNLDMNKEVLQNLIADIEKLDIHKDLDLLSAVLNELKSNAEINSDKIVNEISMLSSKVDSISVEELNQKFDKFEEQFQDNMTINNTSINALKETSSANVERIVNEINNVSEQINNIPTQSIDEKLNNIVEKVTGTSQDLKVLQDNVTEKLSEDDSEKFQVINNSIEFLKETITSSQAANESNLTEKLLALRDMITSGMTSHDDNFAILKKKLDEYVESFDKISNETELKINNSLSEIVDLKLEVERIAKELTDWNSSQENRDSKVVGMISSELDEIGVSIATLQDSVQTGVHQELTRNTEAVELQINKLIDTIENFKEELAQNDEPTYDFDALFKEVKDKITAVKQEVNLVNTDIIDTITTKSDALMMELSSLKTTLDLFEDVDKNIGAKFEEFNSTQNKEFQNIISAIGEIKTIIDSKGEISFDVVTDKITQSAEDIKTSLSEKITSGNDELKSMLTVAMNNDEITWAIDGLKSDLTDKVTKIFNERNHYGEILAGTKVLAGGNAKISKLLDTLNQKVDVLAMADDGDVNFEILDEIEEVKNMISTQKTLLEKTATSDKTDVIENRLQELIDKINLIDTSKDIKEVRESVLTTILGVFEQISFIEESEDIKDFVEEKTDEINQSLIEVKQQLKQIANNDDGYSYTLQDVESDIAKLRIVLSDLSTSTSKEKISDISDNIHRIVSSVEDLQTSLTQEQVSYLKDNFEKLSEDVLSISSRTNKLLLTSDESYIALNNGLNDFSNVIYKLEERINYLDNKEITERIEQKLDNTLSVVTESANSDKVMRQALIYMGEWIDTTSENIESLCEQSSKIDGLEEVLGDLQDKLLEQSQIINLMSDRFDEQQERMDRIEMKLEKILSAIEDIDDTKLTRKVDKLDRQLSKLSNNIEKLTSYVDE
ncbi:MAG: hypothetical protein E7Z93_06030 [Cyanobacteria bacterium SIG32]|nr:hypothetical protein [Cyanobacteria bacterium SIG32]